MVDGAHTLQAPCTPLTPLQVLVSDLDDYEVDSTDDTLTVSAQDTEGLEWSLELTLREYVKPRETDWKSSESAVYITLAKEQEHFWDALVEPPCARHLGPRLKYDLGRWIDIPSDDENRDMSDSLAGPVAVLTEDAELQRAVKAHSLVVVLMHYPWCTKWARRPNEINVLEEFNRAAVTDASLKRFGEVVWGFADLRRNKRLGKRYRIRCEWDLEQNIRVFRDGSAEPWL